MYHLNICVHIQFLWPEIYFFCNDRLCKLRSKHHKNGLLLDQLIQWFEACAVKVNIASFRFFFSISKNMQKHYPSSFHSKLENETQWFRKYFFSKLESKVHTNRNIQNLNILQSTFWQFSSAFIGHPLEYCVTIMCRNDKLSSTMSWVGCLQKDSELFILFAENS